MKKGILLRCELKLAYYAAGRLFIGAIVLMAIISAIAFCAQNILYGDSLIGQINIGIVTEGNSSTQRLALSLLEGMDSVQENCRFLRMEMDEAEAALEAGELSAVMWIPESLVEDIMDGTNTPVKIYFKQEGSLTSAMLKELTNAGANILGSSQAGIYTVYELYTSYGLTDYLQSAYDALNDEFLYYALLREQLFTHETVSATGELTTAQFYMASGLILFIFLWGMNCGSFLCSKNRAFIQKLKSAGISDGIQIFIQWCVLTILYLVPILLLGGAMLLLNSQSLIHLAALIPTAICIAIFMILLYRIADSRSTGLLLVFCMSLIMITLSGGLIPSAFLPESIRRVGTLLPASIMLQQIGSLVSGDIPLREILLLILYSLVFFAATCGIAKWQEVRR